MKKTSQCPKCGSTEIAGPVKMHAKYSFQELDLMIYKSKVSNYVCKDCGYIETYLKKD